MINALLGSVPHPDILHKPPQEKNTSGAPKHWQDLRRLPKWKTLTKSDQRFLKAFYPQRFCRQSFSKLSLLFGISSRKNTYKQMQHYVDKGWITREKRYLKNRKTKKDTGIHLANYYAVTSQGKKRLKELLNSLF